VIPAVDHEGASRREAAERFGVSASSGIKWLQRWQETGSATAKPRGGSVSPLEKHAEMILGLIAEQPDLTLKETVAELLKQRIRTSQSALSRFFGRHGITFKKKPASRRARAGRCSPRAATLDARARHV
jgi:transposase